MADHHEPATVAAQEIAQPGNRVGIEVVRRLVEYQGGSPGEEHPRELDSASLTTRERAQLLGEHPFGKPQAGGYRAGLGLGRPTSEKMELLFEA